MVLFQGLFFLVLGAGLLLMVWRGLSSAWLPFGTAGKIHQSEHASLFWILFTAYAAAGCVLVIFSLLVLAGKAAVLPLS